MAEVLGIVARHGASLRTTGCVIVRPGEAGPVEHAFSRQALSMMAAFSNSWSTVGRIGRRQRLGGVLFFYARSAA